MTVLANSTRVVMLSPFKLGEYQFFRQWAANAWQKTGGTIVDDVHLPWKLKMLLGKLGVVRCLPGKRTKHMLVLCCGRPDYFAWPWCYKYDIIPVLWDCWPKYWESLIRTIKANRIHLIFCTSSQTAEFVRQECPNINAVWLPEGIDVESYPLGGGLNNRRIDVLELGRQMPKVHNALVNFSRRYKITHLYQNRQGLLFPDFASLTAGLRDSKIVISYPRCDTHPLMAGQVETLTQRYWECMLSGTIIAGRAPRELIEFCGYNPVVTLGNCVEEQIADILKDPTQYQGLIRRNRAFAEKNADWSNRMDIIRSALKV